MLPCQTLAAYLSFHIGCKDRREGGRIPNLCCTCELTLARMWKRTFRQDPSTELTRAKGGRGADGRFGKPRPPPWAGTEGTEPKQHTFALGVPLQLAMELVRLHPRPEPNHWKDQRLLPSSHLRAKSRSNEASAQIDREDSPKDSRPSGL